MQSMMQYLDCEDGHFPLARWAPWRFAEGWGSILLVSTAASAAVTAQNDEAIEAGIVHCRCPGGAFGCYDIGIRIT